MTAAISENNRPPQLWQYRDIRDDLRLIHQGDTVIGFDDITDLDEFVPSLFGLVTNVRRMKDKNPRWPEKVTPTYLSSKGDRRHARWSTKALPSEAMRPKLARGRTFNGKFLSVAATLISTAASDPACTHFGPAQMILDADMWSTKGGNIGKSQRLLTYTPRDYTPYSPDLTWTILEGDNADMANLLLHFDSDHDARMARLEMLSRAAILVGAPGLGKDS